MEWALITLGLSLRAWAVMTLHRAGISESDFLRVVRPKEWVTHGPYRYFDHPAYWGSMLIVAGVGMVALGPGGFVLALPLWPLLKWRMAEEEALRGADLPR